MGVGRRSMGFGLQVGFGPILQVRMSLGRESEFVEPLPESFPERALAGILISVH